MHFEPSAFSAISAVNSSVPSKRFTAEHAETAEGINLQVYICITLRSTLQPSAPLYPNQSACALSSVTSSLRTTSSPTLMRPGVITRAVMPPCPRIAL
jgi:hypothetical protein